MNFRAGFDSLPAVQPASVKHELVRFQCRQYSLDERSCKVIIYFVILLSCIRGYLLSSSSGLYMAYIYSSANYSIDYDLCPGSDKFPGFLFISIAGFSKR